jgi:hypothetical protein
MLIMIIAAICPVLILSQDETPPPQETAAPDTPQSPFVGEWKGHTDQGFPIKVKIRNIDNTDKIVEIGYWITLTDDKDETTRSVLPYRSVSAVVEEGKFTCTADFIHSDSLILTGTFIGDTLSGDLQVSYIHPADSSIFDGEVTYKATRALPAPQK